MTFATTFAQVSDAVDYFDKIEAAAGRDVLNLLGIEASLGGQLDGDGTAEMLSALRDGPKSAVSGILTSSSVRGVLEGGIRDLGAVVNSDHASAGELLAIMSDVYDAMVAAGDTVNSRGMTFPNPVFGGVPAFSGAILRLTVDENNFPIESTHAELKTAECIRDQNLGGRKFNETFRFKGVNANNNALKIEGSGKSTEINVSDATESARLLLNPSFSQYSGTLATSGSPQSPTAITGWTVSAGVITDIFADVDTVFRGFVGDATPTAFEFRDNVTIRQEIVDVRAARLSVTTPYWLQVAVFRSGTADGTLTINMGTVSRAITISSLADNDWTIVTILASPGQDTWYERFQEDDLAIQLAYTGRTTGSIFVDDALFIPFKRFDNHWYLIAPAGTGADTVALRGDTATWTDTDGPRAKNQYFLWVAELGYLPSNNGGAETIPDA